MSRASRKQKKSSKVATTIDGLETAGHLADLGVFGLAIALVGGAIGIIVGVFKYMDRRF